MGFSKSAVEQRQEAEALKSFLPFSLIGSLVLHIGVLSFIKGDLLNRPRVEAEPVEVVVVDPPPISKAEQLQVKIREESSGGSAALSGSITDKSQSGLAGGIEVALNPSRQSTPRSTQPSEPKATSTRTLPKPLPMASSVPRATREKQPQPQVSASQKKLIEDLNTAPVQKPRPEPASTPTAVLPSPQFARPIVPTSQPPATINQPPQSKPVAPTQPSLEEDKLKEQLARARSAANSTAESESSGVGDRPARIAAGSGDRTTNGTNTSSGSSVQGSGRNGDPASNPGQGSGRNGGNGTASTGQGSGQVATGTGSSRQGTPRGQGSGEGDVEGTGSGRVACRSNCKPDYPGRARRQGQEGRVAVRVVADANGKVASAEIARSSGNSDLDQAALRQARRAKIEAPPGKPVTMNFNFSLQD